MFMHIMQTTICPATEANLVMNIFIFHVKSMSDAKTFTHSSRLKTVTSELRYIDFEIVKPLLCISGSFSSFTGFDLKIPNFRQIL